MFKFFKKPISKVSNVLDQSVLVKNSYPPEVIEIHNEFHTACDKLLAEAVAIIEKSETPEINKAKRLSILGFSQAQTVEQSTQILKQAEISKEMRELVKHYQVLYPNNKFITEKQVEAICFKYNLICGEVKRFKGFVPEKNVNQIEDFITRYNVPKQIRVTTWGGKEETIISMNDYVRSESVGYVSYRHIQTREHCFQQDRAKEDGINYYGSYIDSQGIKVGSCRMEVIGLQICAPVKDMDMTDMTIKDGYKMRKIHVPDPVVLQPINGGYLVITAWGDEASDENVVNQINN